MHGGHSHAVGRGRHDPARDAAVRRVLIVEGAMNLLVLLAKLFAGFLTGSLALLSDALHSLTDLGNNVIAFLVMRHAGRPPDHNHPYGHRKFETLAVFTLAMLLVVLAVELILRAVVGERTPSVSSPLAFGVVAGGGRWGFERFGVAPGGGCRGLQRFDFGPGSAQLGLQRFRVAPGGARRGLMVARSAHSADCTAVLGQGSRRRTRFTHCVRCAQTVATSQSTKRAARADPCPAILVAPQIAPGGHRLSRRFFSWVKQNKCTRKGVLGQATARLRSAE